MINKTVFLLVISSILLNTEFLKSQWTQPSGPFGGSSVMAVSDSFLFVNKIQGIATYKHDANFGNWTVVNAGLENERIIGIKISGNNVISAANEGLFLSSNKGFSWELVFSDSILIDKHWWGIPVKTLVGVDSILFAGLDGRGIVRSTDNGASWKYVFTNMGGVSINDMKLLGSRLLVGCYSKLWFSQDGGETWNNILNNIKGYDVKTVAIKDEYLYATTDSGLFRSSNNGTSWTMLNTGFKYPLEIYDFADSGTKLYCSYLYNIFESENYGDSWNPISSDLLPGAKTIEIFHNVLYAAAGYGIYYMIPNSNRWSKPGIYSDGGIYAFKALGKTLFAGTQDGVYLTNNSGNDWSYVSKGLFLPETDFQVIALFILGNTIYAGTSDGLFVSTNSGSDWVQVKNDFLGTYVNSIVGKDSCIFVGASEGVFRSTNNGRNWSNIYGSYPSDLAIAGNNLFIGVYDKVYRSTNNGDSWVEVLTTGLTTGHYPKFAVSNESLFVSVTNNIFRSDHAGSDWTSTLPSLPGIYSIYFFEKSIYAATVDGVFKSVDNCSHWYAVNDGLKSEIRELFVFDNYLFAAATNKGVWRRPLSEMITSVEKLSTDLPTYFSLDQNYPNPFNPSTTISFNLPSNVFVSLKIYDALGREISVLCEKELNEGKHLVQWNALNYPSGVYFYRLQAGKYTDIKKLLLLK